MSVDILKKLLSYPITLIGIVMILLGGRWLINDTPWMLDKLANEERLGSSFGDLFIVTKDINLEGYLMQIYRFFGFWVLMIGVFITSFSCPKIIINLKIRKILILIVGGMILFGLYLGYTWIPSSHFIWLAWGMLGIYLISLYAFIKLKNEQ